MTGSRAFIIAIENYPHATDVARRLPRSISDALAFKKWLEDKWTREGVPASEREIVICADPALVPGAVGDTCQQIKQELINFIARNTGATKELFFYFSGHGLSKPTEEKRFDLLVPADYVSEQLSGNLCFKLDEIVYRLTVHMGPGNHYYFIDACRTDAAGIAAVAQITSGPSSTGDAISFVLHSTVSGAAANLNSGFLDELIAGLDGRHRAKTWDGAPHGAMIVTFETLGRYVSTALAQPSMVRSTGFATQAVLNTLSPVKDSTCTIEINGAPSPSGTFTYQRFRSNTSITVPLTGPITPIPLPPDDYTVTVSLDPPCNPSAAQGINVDLYMDREFVFTCGGATQSGGNATLFVNPSTNGSVQLKPFDGGKTITKRGLSELDLKPGAYRATFADADGDVFKEIDVELGDGQNLVLAPLQDAATAAHATLRRLFDADDGPIAFSDDLPPIADPDLDIWLALAAGAHIMGETPAESFLPEALENLTAGQSAIVVLAGSADEDAQLFAGVSDGAEITLRASEHALPGLADVFVTVRPGAHLLSFQFGASKVHTIATYAAANRVTLVTLTLDGSTPRVSQYALPIRHLVQHMHPTVRATLEGRDQMRDLWTLAKATRAFRDRRPLDPALSPVQINSRELQQMLTLKWVDPIATSMAAYELVRRGRADRLGEAIHNLQRFFPDLPDIAALERLMGVPRRVFTGVPLFLDGYRTYMNEHAAFESGKLDYSSLWTTWREATPVRAGWGDVVTRALSLLAAALHRMRPTPS